MLKLSILLFCFLILFSSPAKADCTPATVSRAIVATQSTMGTVTHKGSLYRLVKVTGQGQPDPFLAIYREKGNHCWIAYADQGGDSYSLAEGVPRPVAIAFAKKFIQARIEKYGTAETIAWYSKRKSLAPEDAAALTELKIALPSGIAVSPWPKEIEPEQRVK
jgi:hypothetical protein